MIKRGLLIGTLLFSCGCSFNNEILPEPKEIQYLKYEESSRDFRKHCSRMESCSSYFDNLTMMCVHCGKNDRINCYNDNIRPKIPLYKFAQTEDKSFYYLSPSKNGETMKGVIKLPVNNSCTVTETVLKKNKKEKEEKIRSDNNKKREYGQQKLIGNDAYLIEGYNVYTKVSLQKNDQKCNKNFCEYKTKCSFTYDKEGSYWTRNDKTNCPASLSISEYAKKDEEGFEYYAIENSDNKKIAFQDYVKPDEIEVSVKQYEQRKKMIEQEKSRLPSSCKEVAHLKMKERGIFGGKTDKVITIGDILAEKKVDNYDIKCGRLQNIFNESIVLSIGYAKEGDDYRGVFFKERNGWILCRGIYAGDDIEDDKGKCEYFLSGYGGLIRTSLEELRGF